MDHHTYWIHKSSTPIQTYPEICSLHTGTQISQHMLWGENLWNTLNTLKLTLIKQGHSTTEIDSIMNRSPKYSWENLLQYRKKPSDCTPVVVIYHPSLEPIQSIIKQVRLMLTGDHTQIEIFPKPHLLAFKPHNHAKLFIIRSKLPTNTPTQIRPCHNRHLHCYGDQPFPPPKTPFKIHGTYICLSQMVYLNQSTKCLTSNYVSEMRQSLYSQMNSHKKNDKTQTPYHLQVYTFHRTITL